MEKRPIVRVCLVDDDEDYYIITSDLLREITSFSFKITWFNTFEKALVGLDHPDFDVFVFDYWLGAKTGLDLLRAVIAKNIRIPVIMLTGHGDREIDMEAMKVGAADYLVKGKIDAATLERSIRYAIEHAKVLEELRASRDSLRKTSLELEKALAGINEELEMARRVQKSMLPPTVETRPGFDCSAVFLPTGFVGGDMYDVVHLSDTHVAFLILDVCGHGVPAALISAMAKVSFARYLPKNPSPMAVFSQVNAELCSFMPEGRYATGFLAVLDVKKKELLFSRAGHPPAALASPQKGSVDYLTTGAPLIGAFADSEFEQASVAVAAGDVMVLYTDGLMESVNEKNERYPMKEMEEIMLNAGNKSADAIGKAIISSLKKFAGKTLQHDDITVLVMKVH
ncbi:MAG TPA: SpoIIE family protein phosphatase [Chitinivibrionales bacterium]|nr:SpoIIE family protein phosphatase [Chitinivibrionales bacterium]